MYHAPYTPYQNHYSCAFYNFNNINKEYIDKKIDTELTLLLSMISKTIGGKFGKY